MTRQSVDQSLNYIDISQSPDFVTFTGNRIECRLEKLDEFVFVGHGAEIHMQSTSNGKTVELHALGMAAERIHLRWSGKFDPCMMMLGDHWERGYGDLQWMQIAAERIMPWYFLAYDGQFTHGYGVKTGVSGLCFWQADPSGISLTIDVRAGGDGVLLGDRILKAAEIVFRQGIADETPFAAGHEFCKMMCDNPRLPDHPVYGGNNWYHSYGNSSHEDILNDTQLLVSHCSNTGNPPYMVVDCGWTVNSLVSAGYSPVAGGPWDKGNIKFPDMPGLAASIRSMGAHPGIWIRPLAVGADFDSSLLLPNCRYQNIDAAEPIMDPTIPENLAKVADDIRRLREWGYTLIKHDFSTYDISGNWGFGMGSQITKPGWSFADRSHTTAEVILNLYRTIRSAAGDAVIIGCNTIGHLGAGLFEIQRTGDDTSGTEWDRTRKMGVNTLAFRMPQHEAFFLADADCVGLRKDIPWELNAQWLDLLARSGTPLFVSASPDAVGPEQSAALRRAFEQASSHQPAGEPIDWLTNLTPCKWKFGDTTVNYDWQEHNKEKV
ncbi:hypothetical protein [uncultured Desulfobulbus sp.]|uniref:hypothetical protein n=1 Tax=uncultured Desulfobulbus sp. TaxID=239745 RepID=UPI0029C987B6|nr:hypothetical protein [uncultured Desulfobulbus sp.]